MNKNNAPVTVIRPEEGNVPMQRGHAWGAKIVCLLLAFIIWLYVMQVDSPKHEEIFHSIPVELTNTQVLDGESGLSVYSGYGNTVDVTIIGKKSLIDKISGGDIHVYADVSQIETAGSHAVPIHVEAPAGLTVGTVSQNAISVYCDARASKVVDVEAKISSFTMASNLEMGLLVPEYDTIVVTGPKSALDKVECAQVVLELGNVQASMTASGKLVLMDEFGFRVDDRYLKMSNTYVTVEVPVFSYKTLPLKVEYKHGYFNDSNVHVQVRPMVLEVKGDPAVIDRMTEIVVATLDEKKIIGNVTQLVPLNLPDGLTAADGTENVTIDVSHMGTFTTIFTVTDIDVTGAVGIDYAILDKTLTVTVRGTLEQLSKLRPTDFSAVVDLSGYAENTSGVITEVAEIRIDSSYAAGVYEIGEYTVQVRIN